MDGGGGQRSLGAHQSRQVNLGLCFLTLTHARRPASQNYKVLSTSHHLLSHRQPQSGDESSRFDVCTAL